MFGSALVALVLIAAPDKELSPEAKKLRIAWASQYEWSEDGIKNVTLGFTWKRTYKTRRGEEASATGTGQVVVVGDEIKRVHIEGTGEGPRRREVADGVRWTLARFVRKKFSERFKDAKIEALEKSVAGDDRIQADNVVYVLKNDRIVAVEREVEGGRKGTRLRVDFKLGDMGDGYARIRETRSVKTARGKRVTRKWIEARQETDVPMPARYGLEESRGDGGTLTLAITFQEPKTNQEDPLVIDAAARDLLREAWEQRYVIPAGTRVSASFLRKPGKELTKVRWSRVTGDFATIDVGKVEVALTEKEIKGRSQRDRITKRCTAHLDYLFGLLKDVPFEKEFENCGFSKQESEFGVVIRVFGYDGAVAFRLEEGRIAGYLTNAAGPEDWYVFKLKNSGDGRPLIEKITLTHDGEKKTGRIRYATIKGIKVPKSFQYILLPSRGEGRWAWPFDLCEYVMRKIRVEK